MTKVASSLQREMTAVSGALYVTGALLVAVALAVSAWPDMRRDLLLGFVVSAGLMGTGELVAAWRDRPLPMNAHTVLALGGTVVVSGVVYAGGPEAAGAFGVFYVFVSAFSFYYFSLPWALLEVTMTGLGYGVALNALDVAGAPATWAVVTGANVMVGALIGGLGQRVRHALEAEHESVERLEELDELKSSFLRAVSHELRTPLTGLIGTISTVRAHRHDLPEDTVDHLLQRAVVNSERLATLLGDLLDIDRISRGVITAQRTPTDMPALIRRVLDAVDLGDHPLTFDTEEITVALDAPKVERIVENLVVNAVRHTGGGTPIHVSVVEHEEGCLITVEDHGGGVPDDLKGPLFEPFTQGRKAAESAQPGTGIGLSLVARFTELHGGRAWVEDRPGGGARFLVALPGETDKKRYATVA